METEQNCNILTPTLLAITAFFPVLLGCSTGAPGAQPLWVLVFSTASFLQLIWSPTHLISNWLTSGLYNNFDVHSSSCERHNFALIQPVHGQGYKYPDIPRLDAPLIYTAAFPILTACPGRRSICNTFPKVNVIARLEF